MKDSKGLLPSQIIEQKIYLIRGQKVMLDRDLSQLYGVETRVLKQAVKRNMERFPSDFMFEVDENEINFMVSQNVIPSKKVLGGANPYVFTEQGVAMLSTVLNSKQAIAANIAIMRTFTRLRKLMSTHKELRQKIEEMEKKYDKQFSVVFNAIKQLVEVKESSAKKKIGFHVR